MKKILIVAPYQFGELSDCFYWAKYAVKDGWNVSYLGYKYKEHKIKERICPGVNVISVRHLNNRVLHGMYFIFSIILEILIHKHRNIIVCYFPHCDIIAKLFPKLNVIIDVRTLSVSQDVEERNRADNRLKKTIEKFNKCSVISEGVGDKLGVNYSLLPLGAESLSKKLKVFDSIKLFYIGTFNNRNLDIFIQGFAKFQKETNIESSFDIVGGGIKDDEDRVMNAIAKYGAKNVKMHGYLTHEDAIRYFDKCNVGVCYVPMTDYYDSQPPTKLYEYLLSGMVCISTKTTSNNNVMIDEFGVSVDDDAESVCKGLINISNKLDTYNSILIEKESQKYHWKEIVKNCFLPLFEQ